MVLGSGIYAKRMVEDARSEELCMSDGLRKKMRYMRFLRKRMNTKPSHGPIHFCAPFKILWRTIRGEIYNRPSRFSVKGGKIRDEEDKVSLMVYFGSLTVIDGNE
ncbi:hypothetical protein F3Y22_tig00116961pilonHSYRG00122 [Hibiscus syriacus]|uniref:Uncharacterized protein n=1 Tax=Hibiscus syriacus TaxID=106335 RepID=A0A6A2WJW9_HIBSY|nr:hypothetical protein F3Y22_tig00116961pilonHSYRG00122 [Hibiscus syriacus]